MIWAGIAAAASLAAQFNADLLDAPGNDAVCLFSDNNAKAPRAVSVDVGGPMDTAVLRVVFQGPTGATQPALRVTFTLGDGREVVRTIEAPWPLASLPSSTRYGVPVSLPGVGGAPVLAVDLTVPLGIGAPVKTVTVNQRVNHATLCVLSVTAGVAPVALTPLLPVDAYPFVVSPVLPATPPQSSAIEAPAGQKGFLTVSPEGHLAWSDGSRARFWGVNLVGEAAIPEKADADAYAASLARLGFNMVRFHHIDQDSRGVVAPGRKVPHGMDPERLDRLDWFWHRLREHGVYLWLEFATSRLLTSMDGVSGPWGGIPNGFKLLTMFAPDWTAAYDGWADALWNRVNPHSGLRYPDDPAVAVVELSNEHSLLLAWGKALESLPREHLRILDARWNAWLLEKYGDDASVAAAWTGSRYGGLQAGESLGSGSVAREPRYPVYAAQYPDTRVRDLRAFYTRLERDWYVHLRDQARGMGFRVPISPTLNYARPALQQIQADFDVADAHIAWDKADDGWIRGVSLLTDPGWAFGHAESSMAGQAMAVSELSQAAPNPFRAEAPWLWATLAAVQDWDALLWFSWSDTALARDLSTTPQGAELRTNTVSLAQSPSASAAFRSGWIPAATGRFPLVASSLAGDPLVEDPSRPIELLDPTFMLAHQVRVSVGAPGTRVAGTPVPGIGWWRDPGILIVDRPEVQVRVGPPGAGVDGVGPSEALGLSVDLDGWASVALASADGSALASSRRALLTVATTQGGASLATGLAGTWMPGHGIGPVLLAPARGTIGFAWSVRPVVEALGPDALPIATLPVRRRGKHWEITMDDVRSPWLLVRSPD